jgi:hypothetical protein
MPQNQVKSELDARGRYLPLFSTRSHTSVESMTGGLFSGGSIRSIRRLGPSNLNDRFQTLPILLVFFATSTARALSSTVRKQVRSGLPPTRLTQNQRREARGISTNAPANILPKLMRVCRGCGASVKRDRDYCGTCGLVLATERMPEVARIGRMTAQSSDAQASRTETQHRNAMEQYAWNKAEHPTWLTEKFYVEEIQPRLSKIKLSELMSTLQVCASYAADIRRGKCRPHARHWQKLAKLVAVARSDSSSGL